MFIQKKIALKKTRVHSDDTTIDDPTGCLPWIDVKAYIQKGEVYYQIDNGTIGQGRRYKNYSEKAMMELINKDATAWVIGLGSCNKKKLIKIGKLKNDNESNVIIFETKKNKIKSKKLLKQDTQCQYDFNIDEIPF